MSYMALYRKFRPGGFEDVKGQDHISKTLQNQIKRSGLIIDDEKILSAVSHSSQSRYLMSSARKRSTVTEEEFLSLFNQVNTILTTIGEEIVSGNANALPKEDSDACKYCNYASICRASKSER